MSAACVIVAPAHSPQDIGLADAFELCRAEWFEIVTFAQALGDAAAGDDGAGLAPGFETGGGFTVSPHTSRKSACGR